MTSCEDWKKLTGQILAQSDGSLWLLKAYRPEPTIFLRSLVDQRDLLLHASSLAAEGLTVVERLTEDDLQKAAKCATTSWGEEPRNWIAKLVTEIRILRKESREHS